MTFEWWKILDATEFLATGLVSRTVTVELEGLGEQTFLITRGNRLGITIDDVFLPVQLNGKNPFIFEGRAVYLDGNNVLYYGKQAE